MSGFLTTVAWAEVVTRTRLFAMSRFPTLALAEVVGRTRLVRGVRFLTIVVTT